jgi:hypothetical protein
MLNQSYSEKASGGVPETGWAPKRVARNTSHATESHTGVTFIIQMKKRWRFAPRDRWCSGGAAETKAIADRRRPTSVAGFVEIERPLHSGSVNPELALPAKAGELAELVRDSFERTCR